MVVHLLCTLETRNGLFIILDLMNILVLLLLSVLIASQVEK